MEVYLIRHGETDGNRAWRHQHPNTQLNERGKAQVVKVLEAVLEFEPTHLVTSTNLRAVETTRLIAKETDLIPETSALFEELRRPSKIIGRRFVGLETLKFIVGWFYGVVSDGGESYAQFAQRLGAARSYLETLPTDARVIVVSHSVFINMFVALRCRQKPLTLPQACFHFLKIMRHKNTGVTHLHFKATAHPGTCAWQLKSQSKTTHPKA